MKFKVSEDKKFLVLISSTKLELDQLIYSFTKRIDAWFILRKKIPHWDGKVKFIDTKFNRIPIGLWNEVKKLSDKYHFPLEIEGVEIFSNKNYDATDFEEWIEYCFKNSEDFHPREYQLEASKKILKYRFCTEEISTSGGKTLIAFMIFSYLLNKAIIKKMLYVVPNISLVNQTEEKFYEYEDTCGRKPKWKSQCVFGGAKKNDNLKPNIVFGTFQSLSKKDLDYFSGFDAVCIDEVHHARAKSIKDILVKCYNAQYKFGLTGTLPKEDSCDSFTIQAYLGPMVYQLYSADLIKDGNATPVHVIGIEMDYLNQENKKRLFDLRNVKSDEKDGVKLLNLEKDIARENRKRFIYVCETIDKSTKNSIVLFADIKNSYGRSVYNWLKENTEKNVYYIDGGTKVDNRDYYKKKMDEEDNIIIVASVGTFSEGIDINNVFNIFISESHKSEIIVAQILGRGMRLMPEKDKIQVIDFSDNFEYGSGFQRKNYLMRHAEERQRIYKKRKFPFKQFRVKL
jgi:superfamily II DNA or RNA helicase